MTDGAERPGGRADEHVPTTPGWNCGSCGEEWPCATKRGRLLAEYGGDRAMLSVYLGSCLAAARRICVPPRSCPCRIASSADPAPPLTCQAADSRTPPVAPPSVGATAGHRLGRRGSGASGPPRQGEAATPATAASTPPRRSRSSASRDPAARPPASRPRRRLRVLRGYGGEHGPRPGVRHQWRGQFTVLGRGAPVGGDSDEQVHVDGRTEIGLGQFHDGEPDDVRAGKRVGRPRLGPGRTSRSVQPSATLDGFASTAGSAPGVQACRRRSPSKTSRVQVDAPERASGT